MDVSNNAGGPQPIAPPITPPVLPPDAGQRELIQEPPPPIPIPRPERATPINDPPAAAEPLRGLSCRASARDYIGLLRSRAAHYQHMATRTQDRAQVFFYYRALAADLEDTVIDFERLVDSPAPALSRAVH
jgi:hypothetical protein